ncbi:hypothetical protein TNCV_3925871 [Trichonephila clavipes]|nr:hypothetical protein TNCV_3925871 [Trichonephila clavipes]
MDNQDLVYEKHPKYLGWILNGLWIPCHINIFRNEQADLLAKEGCNASSPISSTFTYSEHQSRVKSEILKEWRTPLNHHWKTFAPSARLSKPLRLLGTFERGPFFISPPGIGLLKGQWSFRSCLTPSDRQD